MILGPRPGSDLDPFHHPHHMIVIKQGLTGQAKEWRMGESRGRRRRAATSSGTSSSSPLPRTGEKKVEREMITGRKGLASSVCSEATLSVREKRMAAMLPRREWQRVNKIRRVPNSWEGIQSPRWGGGGREEVVLPRGRDSSLTSQLAARLTIFLIFQIILIIRSSTCVTTVIEWVSSLVLEGLFSHHSMRLATGRGRWWWWCWWWWQLRRWSWRFRLRREVQTHFFSFIHLTFSQLT